MSTQVVVPLPDEVYQQAQGLAQRTGRDLITVLADLLTVSLSMLTQPARGQTTVSELSDQELLSQADLQMPGEQDRRLSYLLDRQQTTGLSASERVELVALMNVYQEGLLRKAQSLSEAVRRGLRPPLAA